MADQVGWVGNQPLDFESVLGSTAKEIKDRPIGAPSELKMVRAISRTIDTTSLNAHTFANLMREQPVGIQVNLWNIMEAMLKVWCQAYVNGETYSPEHEALCREAWFIQGEPTRNV